MTISKTRFSGAILMIVLLSLAACTMPMGNHGTAPISPTEDTPISTMGSETVTASTATPTCRVNSKVKNAFLEVLGKDEGSCLPDQTRQSLGVYIYDLDKDTELVSINAEVPFQFASVFKGPLLVYFLDNCRKYWDTTSLEWNTFFLDPAPIYSVDMYNSEAYRHILVPYLSDVANWETIQDFSMANRALVNGVSGPLDQRYFILKHVYSMVTHSDNLSAGIVLKFVFDSCLPNPSPVIERACGGSNAITEFNQWYFGFSEIENAPGEAHRGLNSWDTILSIDTDGNVVETQMETLGLSDACATQSAYLNCPRTVSPSNAWTAMDLFRFYYSLFHRNDTSMKNIAMEILKIDHAGISRGYMKNMAKKMNATAMSKNGLYGDIVADAGILEYQQRHYIVITLSFDALDSMIALYGQYNLSGEPTSDQVSLIQALLEGNLDIKQLPCLKD